MAEGEDVIDIDIPEQDPQNTPPIIDIEISGAGPEQTWQEHAKLMGDSNESEALQQQRQWREAGKIATVMFNAKDENNQEVLSEIGEITRKFINYSEDNKLMGDELELVVAPGLVGREGGKARSETYYADVYMKPGFDSLNMSREQLAQHRDGFKAHSEIELG